jgi:hypothetical protein
MNEFKSDPTFKIGGSRQFLMQEDLWYHSDRYGLMCVPANPANPFSTDFASIPLTIPKWLLNPIGGGWLDTHGHSRFPAVLHDYLCRTAKSYKERVIADKIFLEAMKATGVNGISRRLMYSAVRLNTERMKLMRKWK